MADNTKMPHNFVALYWIDVLAHIPDLSSFMTLHDVKAFVGKPDMVFTYTADDIPEDTTICEFTVSSNNPETHVFLQGDRRMMTENIQQIEEQRFDQAAIWDMTRDVPMDATLLWGQVSNWHVYAMAYTMKMFRLTGGPNLRGHQVRFQGQGICTLTYVNQEMIGRIDAFPTHLRRT